MIDLENYGWEEFFRKEPYDGIPARVTAVRRNRYELVSCYGEIYAGLKKSMYYNGYEEFPTVGDFVIVQYVTTGDSLIIKTLKRKSFFSRKDPSPGALEQAIAANFDYVFVMSSLNRDFNLSRLERYLTQSFQSGARPVIILTKADLANNIDSYIHDVAEIAFGLDIIAVSVVTGYGLDRVRNYLEPKKTVVFLGSSGVGKSSLLNAIIGDEVMDVGAVREDDNRGRHTTTHRELFMLDNGAMVIDTPGMRELGMWDVTEGLDLSFLDVSEILKRPCRFLDCNHKSEPGCAVKEAIVSGELSSERWESYLKLKHEAKYSEDKDTFMAEKWQRNKEIAKFTRQIDKRR